MRRREVAAALADRVVVERVATSGWPGASPVEIVATTGWGRLGPRRARGRVSVRDPRACGVAHRVQPVRRMTSNAPSLALAVAVAACVPSTVGDADPPSPDALPSSGAGTNTGGGGGSGGNGLFAATSPWNTPATGRVDPTSPLLISSGEIGSLAYSFAKTGRGFDIAGTADYPDYGIPLVKADAASPRVAIKDTYGWWGGPFPAVPMPVNATPAAGTDHHLSIWDVAGHTLWEFWELVRLPDGSWTAGAGVKFDTRGDGFQTAPWAISARAYGGAAIAGAILLDEMKAGVIDHALGMSYPWTRGQKYALGLGADGVTRNIASHSDNAPDVDRNRPSNIPEGARLRLKASVDIAARCGTNRACRVIGTALAKYGAYVVDTAGVATFYAEVLTGRAETWTGVLGVTDARAFQADDFELLSLPATLTAAPN